MKILEQFLIQNKNTNEGYGLGTWSGCEFNFRLRKPGEKQIATF